MKLTKADYSAEAIERAKGGALAWLEDHDEGRPRTWAQEASDTERRGYEQYESDFEAPPIAGYEELEAQGYVIRLGASVSESGQEREHFRITPAGRAALEANNG